MNKKIIIFFILIVLIFANIVLAVTIYPNINSNKIVVGENLEFTINFEEPIITADFSISFDSDKWEYIEATTEKLKTNYIEEKSEINCCYYDLNKVETNNITFKFKAKKETNKTKIKVTNITIHTKAEEKQMENFETENIRITNDNQLVENTIETNNELTNNTTVNSNTIEYNTIINNEKNLVTDKTQADMTLPKTGYRFDLFNVIAIIITIIICLLIIRYDEFSIKTKVISSIIVILIALTAILCKNVIAANNDKIYINKQEKTILIMLSTSNETRNMSIETFKKETKAVSILENTLVSGSTATFENNEKYIVKIYGDENKNGYVNSSDIFELLNQEEINNEYIDEISNFIIKKEEFKEENIKKNGFEEFTDKSITTNLTPLEPATDRYNTIKNIEELINLDAKVGDKYKTLGYYKENDGGAGRYDIIEKNSNIKIDNGLYIELKNGLIAKLAIINNTVNVKQFGAKGNAVNDETKYLKTAFNSWNENIELPKGEYKITDKISLDNTFTNIIGNDSTIFTDNDYKPEKYSEFLFIIATNDCNMQNLNIEARETKKIDNLYKSQLYIGATNIKITGCTFKVPETASSENSYGNIDLYTGWHNVLIENCNLYLANDAKEGGCIWVRDLFNRGASDLTFINNKCYKKTHDEILAVFMGSIENVNILNNIFIMAESTDPSTMSFTLGSKSSKKAQNIKFEGNTIDTKATMDLIVSRNATNLSIKNNKIKFERVTTLTNTFVFYFPEDNLENVVIEKNTIDINNNTKTAINGFISSSSKNVII